MLSLISTLTLALYAVTATANAPLEPRQGTSSLSSVQCGRTTYSKQQVDEAVAEGCRLYAAGEQTGNNDYPHRFNNREGLVFAASGPYQEFPILSSGSVYTGRSPGADRIVFNPSLNGACVYVGAMTHTGASSRNGFVSCTETSAASSDSGSGSSSSSTSTATVTTITGTRTNPSSTSSTSTTTTTSTATTTSDPDLNGAPRLGGLDGMGVLVGAVVGLLLW